MTNRSVASYSVFDFKMLSVIETALKFQFHYSLGTRINWILGADWQFIPNGDPSDKGLSCQSLRLDLELNYLAKPTCKESHH